MHAEAFAYLQRVRGFFPDVSAFKVLEFGAHDVNGSPRQLFAGCAEYMGVDPWPGQGVDIVSKAQDYDGKEGYDIVISAETLEHDPDPIGQISSAWWALKPGGKLILTAAAEPRAPHKCDGSVGDLGGEYYGNIDPGDLRSKLTASCFTVFEIQHDRKHGDVYAVAVKP